MTFSVMVPTGLYVVMWRSVALSEETVDPSAGQDGTAPVSNAPTRGLVITYLRNLSILRHQQRFEY
jgi:hypothetical protein